MISFYRVRIMLILLSVSMHRVCIYAHIICVLFGIIMRFLVYLNKDQIQSKLQLKVLECFHPTSFRVNI